jgi:hypothetical protein
VQVELDALDPNASLDLLLGTQYLYPCLSE